MSACRNKIADWIAEETRVDPVWAKDLEIGIYNWTIDECERHGIVKSWDTFKFNQLYRKKALSVIANLVPSKHVRNDSLLPRLLSGEFWPHDVPYMRPENTFPRFWQETANDYLTRFKSAYEMNAIPMTDMFKCSRCKKKECTYYEIFSRAADEPAVIHIRCCNCGHSWKIG
jgi:DNA-directed RNA polymerase subunit M/transcription elongation factor TFIIS